METTVKFSDDELANFKTVLDGADWECDEDNRVLQAIVDDGTADIDMAIRAFSFLDRMAGAEDADISEAVYQACIVLNRAMNALSLDLGDSFAATVVYLDYALAEALGQQIAFLLSHSKHPARWVTGLRHVAQYGVAWRTRHHANAAKVALTHLLADPSTDIAITVPARAAFVAIQRALDLVETA